MLSILSVYYVYTLCSFLVSLIGLIRRPQLLPRKEDQPQALSQGLWECGLLVMLLDVVVAISGSSLNF